MAGPCARPQPCRKQAANSSSHHATTEASSSEPELLRYIKSQRWPSAFNTPLHIGLTSDAEVENADVIAVSYFKPQYSRARLLHRRSRILRCTMFLILFATLVALLSVFQHRKETDLRTIWTPDPETRLFEQRPLLPPLERNSITNHSLPLRTSGRKIVDTNGKRFKLASMNWYGASDELFVPGGLDVLHRKEIAESIKRLGFNSVRLPYADEMLMRNPIPDQAHVLANPDLMGLRAMDVFEAVTTTLTDAGLAVIINDHITSATWCCGANPCDASWSNDYLGPLCRVKMSEEKWIQNWETMMSRFVHNPLVIGADLRNEVRGLWGTMTWSSWASAAERCGNRLLDLNPDWLIVVEGISSANDLSGARSRPVNLKIANKLVYSAHVYAWSGWGSWAGRFKQQSYGTFRNAMKRNWGYLLEQDVAPVWVGEIGAPRQPTKGDANYWMNLWRYLKAMDADFGYWAINPRKPTGSKETYSIVAEDWRTAIRDYRLKQMTDLIRA
ncbi:cellulase (glycosyl hydrolase family 5) domain-containing protein [Sarocladium implicatum]|nr:cellulase (glycosyl hydrolase family 5) domain-containing protein [Sarocladium implicatum]